MKYLKIALSALLCCASVLAFTSCTSENPNEKETTTANLTTTANVTTTENVSTTTITPTTKATANQNALTFNGYIIKDCVAQVYSIGKEGLYIPDYYVDSDKDKNTDKTMLKKCEDIYNQKYSFYSEGKLLGEYDCKLAFESYEGGYKVYYDHENVELDSSSFIAVAGDADIYPNKITRSTEYTNKTVLDEIYKKLGTTESTTKVIENITADIDNNGSEENIVTVSDGKKNSALVLIDQNTIVSYLELYQIKTGSDLYRYPVEDYSFELADTNGDKVMEIFFSAPCYEGSDIQSYIYKDGKFNGSSKMGEVENNGPVLP